MAFTNINVGTVANDGTGDSLRAAGLVINANFGLAALDAGVVHLTGDETVAGIKTFSSIPVGPASDPTTDNQLARKKYVDDSIIAGIATNDAMIFKGVIDCSANPNYPAADRGHTYKVSVAGKIGGASGLNVQVGDMLICITDATAAGTQASVGAQWSIVQNNIDGAVTLVGASFGDHIPIFSSGNAVIDSGLDFNNIMLLTGNQTVAGIKTFSSIPLGPASDPTTANQLTRKSYVDAGVAAIGVTGLSSALPLMDGVATVGTATKAAREDHVHPTDTSRAADAAVVHLTGTESVGGDKLFDDAGIWIANLNAAGFNLRLRYNDASATANNILGFVLGGANRNLIINATTTLGGGNHSGVNTGDGAPQFTGGISADKNANYTLVLGDAFTAISFKLTATRTVTIPLNSSVAFPIGTQILIAIDWVSGTDSLNLSPSGAVVIRGITGVLVSSTATQKALLLTKVATNTWVSLGTL